jgi:hypothetical protein
MVEDGLRKISQSVHCTILYSEQFITENEKKRERGRRGFTTLFTAAGVQPFTILL